jgi:hypothetical protein
MRVQRIPSIDIERIRAKLDKGYELIELPKTQEELEERIEFIFNSTYDDFEEFLKAKRLAVRDYQYEDMKANYLRIVNS